MNKTIAVIFGGQSAEHEVSIITAHIPIIQSLKVIGEYDIVPIYIAQDGSWYSDQSFNELAFFQQPDFLDQIQKQKKLEIAFDGGLHLVWPGLRARKVKIDIVFPAMHGTNGEDGSLMGLLRLANVPFVGCDLAASAVAMDKALTKQVIESQGVPVVPYVWFTAADWMSRQSELLAKVKALQWPLFVKPVHLGSSIGISKATNETELLNAIEVALHYDNKVLVEESVQNLIEVTLPVMGNDVVQFAEIERPLNKSDFFDFSDKYLSGGKKGQGVNSPYSEVPANISHELQARVKEFAEKTYKTLGCSGIARIDFLINEASNQVYVNEVNTLPGSLYHHNWRKAGVSNVELIKRLIDLAEERFSKSTQVNHSFNSDILQKVNGAKQQS